MVRTKKTHINYKHKCVADSIFYVYVLLQKSLDLLALQFTASVNLNYTNAARATTVSGMKLREHIA